MKILLVSEREEIKGYIRKNFMPRGAEIIQYYNPIKAMDNLDELEPDVVLFSGQDFPRHWKPFLVFLRDSRAREQCVFVLLTGRDFDHEDADKAQALQVNGILHERLEDHRELARLKEVVSRYRDIGDSRTEKRHVPTLLDRISFLVTHPKRLELVPGTVEDLSAAGISFVPRERQLILDLSVGQLIPSCSLRVGEAIISFSARVIRNERTLSLAFDLLSSPQRAMIRSYIEEYSSRELERTLHDTPTAVEPA